MKKRYSRFTWIISFVLRKCPKQIQMQIDSFIYQYNRMEKIRISFIFFSLSLCSYIQKCPKLLLKYLNLEFVQITNNSLQSTLTNMRAKHIEHRSSNHTRSTSLLLDRIYTCIRFRNAFNTLRMLRIKIHKSVIYMDQVLFFLQLGEHRLGLFTVLSLLLLLIHSECSQKRKKNHFEFK